MKIYTTNISITLKKATLSDVRYCYQLSKRNMSRYKSDKRTFKQYKDEFNPLDVKVVWYKGRRFGYIEYQKKTDGWYLWDMQLSTILQGNGLGSKLLESVISNVQNKGGKKLKLFVYKNNPAIDLYRKFGFKVKKSVSENRVSMELQLR